MFGMLESLAKATVSTVLVPVAIVKDTVGIPFDAANGGDPYADSKKVIKNVKDNLSDATRPSHLK